MMLTTFRISYRAIRFFISVLLLLVLTCVLIVTEGTGGNQGAKFPRQVQSAFDKRDSQITDELERLPLQEWAGEYYFGGGIGNRGVFKLAPISGFVARLGGCTGVYAINYGVVIEADGRIKLLTKLPPDHRASWKSVIEMFPVRWGERHYLLSDDEVIDFCNAVNAGQEPDRLYGGFFLLRRDDEKKQVSGVPGIPEHYREYLLASPVQAEISFLHSSRIEVDKDYNDWKERITRVTLNAGYAEGLRVGMELHAFEPRNFESAKILQVSEHSAEAEMRQFGADGEIPQTGWKMSTRIHY
jgi:hypothetical protein